MKSILELQQEIIDLRIAGQKLAGVISNIRNETYELADFYYEWMDKVINETDEILIDDEDE